MNRFAFLLNYIVCHVNVAVFQVNYAVFHGNCTVFPLNYTVFHLEYTAFLLHRDCIVSLLIYMVHLVGRIVSHQYYSASLVGCVDSTHKAGSVVLSLNHVNCCGTWGVFVHSCSVLAGVGHTDHAVWLGCLSGGACCHGRSSTDQADLGNYCGL